MTDNTTTKLEKIKELYRADVPPRACSVYLYLFQRCYNKEYCFPSIMFDSFLDGHTLSQIADELEERGHLTPSGLPRWSKAGIKRVLTNEKYTGDVLTQKTSEKGYGVL